MSDIETWFLKNRRELPWRQERSAYRVWLSEIMLQQTQVATVIDYFYRFTERFPTVFDLANASEDDVLALWSGLGYYSRARNLHRTAKQVVHQWQGEFPSNLEDLLTLPGVGSYTAGAISAFAFNKPAPVVDGNIARVLSRWFNDHTEWNTPFGKKHFEKISYDVAQQAINPSDWHEGLMELGATLCRSKDPECEKCPLISLCQAKRVGTISLLPRRAAKRARTQLMLVCAIITNGNYVWLEKNLKRGLFSGLYLPPHLRVDAEDSIANAIADILAERGFVNVSVEPTPIIVERTLTHRDLTLYGFLAHTKETSIDAEHWIPRRELSQVGLPKAFQLLLEASLK